MAGRAWAMRTSRNTEKDRTFIVSELGEGRLRQGWGYSPCQDLRKIEGKQSSTGYASLHDDEKAAWGHWKMAGEALVNSKDSIKEDDIVLIPNMPTEGLFTLCRVTGSYSYAIDASMLDFGHIRPIELLTPGGVANSHGSSGLVRSLRCRSRLWSLDNHLESINDVLSLYVEKGQSLRSGVDHLTRASRAIAPALDRSLNELALAIESPLRSNLQSAEWEPVLEAALSPLMKNVEVYQTGGPNEKGADLEIHIPNPFMPGSPWVVVVQIKDYVDEISVQVADQLEQAITERRDRDVRVGQLIAVVLASTSALPSKALLKRIDELVEKYGTPVACVHGHDLMRVLARGFFVRSERKGIFVS